MSQRGVAQAFVMSKILKMNACISMHYFSRGAEEPTRTRRSADLRIPPRLGMREATSAWYPPSPNQRRLSRAPLVQPSKCRATTSPARPATPGSSPGPWPRRPRRPHGVRRPASGRGRPRACQRRAAVRSRARRQSPTARACGWRRVARYWLGMTMSGSAPSARSRSACRAASTCANEKRPPSTFCWR